MQYAKISIDISLTIATQYLFDLIAHYKFNFKASCLDLVQMGAYQTTFIVHRVKFLKTFEFGAQRGEGYRGESALLCSQFQTQF